MAKIELNDSDLHFLRQCPQSIPCKPTGRPSRDYLDRLKRVARFQKAGLVRGVLDSGERAGDLVMMRISLTDAGRRAIGFPVSS